mgnify:CR=1 FL=1
MPRPDDSASLDLFLPDRTFHAGFRYVKGVADWISRFLKMLFSELYQHFGEYGLPYGPGCQGEQETKFPTSL